MHCPPPKIYFSVSASIPSKGSFSHSSSNNLGQAVELRNDIMKKASSNSIESSPISTWPSTSTTTTFWSAMQANYVAVASNKILLTPVCMALMVPWLLRTGLAETSVLQAFEKSPSPARLMHRCCRDTASASSQRMWRLLPHPPTTLE